MNNIKEIIMMGGTKKDGTKYNINMNAGAANIAFNCGIKIIVMGTDVTQKVEITVEIF